MKGQDHGWMLQAPGEELLRVRIFVWVLQGWGRGERACEVLACDGCSANGNSYKTGKKASDDAGSGLPWWSSG